MDINFLHLCELTEIAKQLRCPAFTKSKFDLAGFSVGLVSKKILKKGNVKANDIVLAFNNWYSFKWFFSCDKNYKQKKITNQIKKRYFETDKNYCK